MKFKFKKLIKPFAFIGALAIAIGSFVVPSYAYELNTEGNLISSNLALNTSHSYTAAAFVPYYNESFNTSNYHNLDLTVSYDYLSTTNNGYNFLEVYNGSTKLVGGSNVVTFNVGNLNSVTFRWYCYNGATMGGQNSTYYNIMINKGIYPLPFEEKNIIYYSQNNYNNSYQNGYDEGLDTGYQNGYNEGLDTGYQNGYNEGLDTGYQNGYDEGLDTGYQNGYDEGLDTGYQNGYDEGLDIGYQNGYNEGLNDNSSYQNGYDTGLNTGYQNGYNEGYNNALVNNQLGIGSFINYGEFQVGNYWYYSDFDSNNTEFNITQLVEKGIISNNAINLSVPDNLFQNNYSNVNYTFNIKQSPLVNFIRFGAKFCDFNLSYYLTNGVVITKRINTNDFDTFDFIEDSLVLDNLEVLVEEINITASSPDSLNSIFFDSTYYLGFDKGYRSR